MGKLSKYSSGTEDLEEVAHSQQTEEQGDREALYCLGRRYETGEGRERDYGKAEFYYRQAAELGHIRAQCCLGIMYEQGIGVKCNGEKAMYWFREAAEQEDAAAQYLLGKRILRQSRGSERQHLEAAEWYQKAAEQEYIPAQSALSDMYAAGTGVKQDYEKAVYWFQKSYQLTRLSAEQGNCDGQYSLGSIYAYGRIGLKQDKKMAVEWYRKAAVQGHVMAQLSLGKIYAKGEGVNRDVNEAIKWYEKAAAQGHIGALLRLGNMYAQGKEIEKNSLKARKYYKLAEEMLVEDAERGNVPAQRELADLYKLGKIGETDYDNSYFPHKNSIKPHWFQGILYQK